MRRNVILILVAAVAISQFGCEAMNNNPNGSGDETVGPTSLTPLAILQHHSGANGGPKGPTVMLAQSAADLEAAGAEALARNPIDFDTVSVILLAVGEQPTGGFSAKIEGVQQIGDTLHVQGVVTTPGPGAITTQAFTQAWAAAEIEKVGDVQIKSVIRSETTE